MKLKDRILNHPGVESVDDGLPLDSFFVNLKPGFSFDFEARSAGFDTVREAYTAVRAIRTVEEETE